MRKGYHFEHEIEELFLKLAGQTRDIPLIDRCFRVPASGSLRGLKGDVYTNVPFLKKQFLIECKARKVKKAFYVKREWLTKLEEEAKNINHIPLLAISFKGAKKDRVFFFIKKKDYSELFGTEIKTGPRIPFRKKSYVLERPISSFSECNGWIILSKDTFFRLLNELICLRQT